MKKFLTLTMCSFMICAALTACGGTAENSAPPEEPAVSESGEVSDDTPVTENELTALKDAIDNVKDELSAIKSKVENSGSKLTDEQSEKMETIEKGLQDLDGREKPETKSALNAYREEVDSIHKQTHELSDELSVPTND